ncbi:hypothetical protein ApDm4_0655 [Acetobacter pomorum]|nr:hypothetical protein ApDm4_0655 [Acetobacter pomorum]
MQVENYTTDARISIYHELITYLEASPAPQNTHMLLTTTCKGK